MNYETEVERITHAVYAGDSQRVPEQDVRVLLAYITYLKQHAIPEAYGQGWDEHEEMLYEESAGDDL